MQARPRMRHCCLPFGLAAPRAGRFNQRRPGSSCGSHRERPQAGEPGVAPQFPMGSQMAGPGTIKPDYSLPKGCLYIV